MKKTDLFPDNNQLLTTDEVKAAAITPVGPTAVAPFADLGFSVTDNLEGCQMRPPQIGIIAAAQLFRMPDGSQVKQIEGVLIDSNRCNAYWKADMSAGGSGNPPDCASFDGVKPYTEAPVHADCAGCPMNKYGSGKDGSGKACKNMRRVHVLAQGELIPYRLTLPPTSLRAFDDYMTALTQKGRPCQTVVTAITLAKAKNKKGIEYSGAVFAMVSMIDDLDVLRPIAAMRADMKPKLRDKVEADEYVTPTHEGPDPF